MPAAKRTRGTVVTNLREQPVEIHLTGGVIVIEPLGKVELDEAAGGGGAHLAELERQELVAVSPPPAEPSAKRPAAPRSRSSKTRRASSPTKDTTPPKPPEGGS